jgi:Putative addiction module component
MTTSDIKGMSKTEKLQAMEVLWDSLIHEESEIESPEWHQDILAGRRQKITEGKAEFLTIAELKSKYH